MLERKEYIRKRFKEIIKAKENNNISVFIGAGVSKLSGSLTWNELISEMMQELGITEEKNQEKFQKEYSQMAIAEIYEGKFGQNTYQTFISEKLGVNLTENEIMQKIIRELSPQNFITTNYDTLIENELTDLGCINNYDIIKEDKDFADSKVCKKIIKMHGSLDKKNIVLKETDYLEYSEKFKLIETVVKSVIAGNKVIFFGYSLQDNNVKQIINWIQVLTKDSGNKPILFLVNGPIKNEEYKEGVDKKEDQIKFKSLSEDEIKYYHKIGVDVIQFHELEIFSKEEYMKQMEEGKHFEYAYKTFFEYLAYVEQMKYILTDEKFKLLYNDLVEITQDKYIRLEDCKGIFKKYGLTISSTMIIIEDKDLLDLLKKYIGSEDVTQNKMSKFIVEFIYERAGRFEDREISNLINERYDMTSVIQCTYNHINTISNNTEKEKNNIKEDLKRAYYYFYNGEGSKASELYSKVKKTSRNEKNIFFYVIAAVNEYVCNRIQFKSGIEERKELNDILQNLPEETKNKYPIISEIIDFNITKRQIKSYKYLIKSYDEAYNKSNTISLCNSDFIELIDLYNCIKENYLLIDVFSDVKSIFEMYVEGAIIRYLYKSKRKENRKNKEDSFINDEDDIASKMDVKKLVWALEYCNKDFIKEHFNIFTDFNLEEDRNEEIIKYSLEYIEYLINLQNKKQFMIPDGASVECKMSNIVCFLQAFNMKGETITKLLELILDYKFLNRDLMIYISNIIYKYSQTNSLNDEVENNLKKLCYNEIRYRLEEDSSKEKRSIINDALEKNNIKLNTTEINKIFNEYIIDNENYEIYMQFMSYLSKSNKDNILKYCKDTLKKEPNMKLISRIAEYNVPIDISKFASFVEEYLSDEDNWTNVHKGKFGTTYGHYKDMTINYILAMGDKLTKKQKEIIISKDNSYALFFDYENFDYDKFEASYLLNATHYFILKITEDEEKRKIIVNKIALEINGVNSQEDINEYTKILKIINSRDFKYYYEK